MSLIKCTECGKEISDKANSCPNCGFPIIEKLEKNMKDPFETQQEDGENEEKEKILKEIYEAKSGSMAWKLFCGISVVFLIGTMIYKSVGGIIISLALFVLFYALSKDCEKKSKKIQEENGISKEEILGYEKLELSGKMKQNNMRRNEEAKGSRKTVCPYCNSLNTRITIETTGEKERGNTETRKKSYVTRKANKKARRGMILATGGLWALTPKKSEYKDVIKTKTTYKMKKIAVCQDCGNVWSVI